MADQWGLIPLPLGQQFDPAASEQPQQPADIFGGFIAGWQQPAGGFSASVAVTDGADVASATVSLVVATSSATTNGADTAAGSVSVVVGASSATTNGADVGSASVSVLIGASSATTDGADVLSASVSPVVATSSATTDGEDVLAAVVANANALNFSADLADGADALDALVQTTQAAGGYDDEKKKRRYVVKVGNRLKVFASAQAAMSALDAQPAEQPAEPQEDQPEPVAEVPISQIKAMAREREAMEMFQARMKALEYEALLRLYEEWQDEEDIEMLLMVA